MNEKDKEKVLFLNQESYWKVNEVMKYMEENHVKDKDDFIKNTLYDVSNLLQDTAALFNCDLKHMKKMDNYEIVLKIFRYFIMYYKELDNRECDILDKKLKYFIHYLRSEFDIPEEDDPENRNAKNTCKFNEYDMDIALSYFRNSITNITLLSEALTYQKDLGKQDIEALISTVSNCLIRGYNNMCQIAFLLTGKEFEEINDTYTHFEKDLAELSNQVE